MAITARQKQFAVTSAAGVLLTGVVLVLVNVLGHWLYLRWDITRSHAYSLSPASKKLVRSLDNPVLIKAYFSKDLPAPYNTYARYVQDLLVEYRATSRGRVRFEFIPTQPAQTFETRAMEAGMSPMQFEEMGSDQLQIRRGFMGLVLFYRDRSEAIPVVKSADHLEYDLTSRIARMARKSKKIVAVTRGHGESEWRSSQLKLAQDLPAFYDLDHTVDLPLTTTGAIQADALLVVGPTSKFDETSLWEIDQAIMRGIPAAFLLDSRRFMAGQFLMMPPQPTGLEDLLKAYGVDLTDQLVYDAQCETVGMTQNVGGLTFTTSIRYPYVPLVTRFENGHPILQGVEAVGLPFASRLEPTRSPGAGAFTSLLMSSDQSWIAPKNTYSVAPNSIPRPAPGEPHGPYALGGVVEGSFPSYFAGKPSPVKGANAIARSPRTTIFVLGTSHILDSTLPEFQGAAALMTNALAYLTHDDTLIGIQSKGELLRPLKPMPGVVKDAVKVLCIFLIPLLPVLWGLARWRRRESWRKRITAGLAPQKPAAAPVEEPALR
jgi:gliding-associated putative ABC transporter substrate-binding component GldG